MFGSRRKTRSPRLAIIGLDCAAPALLFDDFAGELPNLDRLRREGVSGPLESVIPAITVPAWACMMSGRDPGSLGVYGFRNRVDHSYERMSIANGSSIHEPRLWDLLSLQNRKVIVVGVPQTYPPRPVNGSLVASFLTPSIEHEYTYPADLKHRIAKWVGEYMLDVPGFRTDRKDWLLDQIHTMTRKRFEVARRLLDSEPWDFFMMVEMGVDRMHHGFWKEMDPAHRRYTPGSPYRDAIREYYRYIDGEIGTLLERFPAGTHVLVVSDHGAKKMDGGICINEWLIREGYLVLEERPDTSAGPVRFEKLRVDWKRTRAWGEGGYYGRVFINLRGREPEGTVEPADYEALRDELIEKLEALPDEDGQPIGTRCFKPQRIYRHTRGVPPDLIVYFGDLDWRSVGSVGWDAIHVLENDTGPDDANHAQDGVFLYSRLGEHFGGVRVEGLHLLQVAPTALRLAGLSVPFDMPMRPIPEVVDAAVTVPR